MVLYFSILASRHSARYPKELRRYANPSLSHSLSDVLKTLWRTKFALLMARERGRIGSDAALGDMPKRLQAHSYDEMNEGPAR